MALFHLWTFLHQDRPPAPGLAAHPQVITAWLMHVNQQCSSTLDMLKTSALVFPQLALGMSGFETGVAVMPLIRSGATGAGALAGRIRHTRFLLVTVAVLMSVFLLAGSLVTTVLIPPELFREGAPANGRALAYIRDTTGTVPHTYFGWTEGHPLCLWITIHLVW
jgi:hypothetical protein